MSDLAGANAVSVRDVGIRFGGVWAVKGVSLDVPAGQNRAVIGPNGAGKTTFLNLISGVLLPTKGTIQLLGQNVTRKPPHLRNRMGMGRTYQVTNLFRKLTVMENIYLASLGRAGGKYRWIFHRHAQQLSDVVRHAEEALVRVGLSDKANELVAHLSHGEQRQLEIGVAIAAEPRVLLLDEPLAGLSPAERVDMTRIVKEIDPSVTIMLIEHDMEMVMQVADMITVLNHGEVVAEGTPAEIRQNEQVQKVYLGAAV